MAQEDFVTLVEFAELSGQDLTRISQLCAEPKIKTVMWGNRRHIDTSIYNPSDFKPKKK